MRVITVIVLAIVSSIQCWREALVIASIVPFAVSFAFAWIGRFGVGLIALSGIIIKNAIVLIDQIDIERDALSLDDAMIAASRP